jgi:hypothetical protein
MRERRVSGVSDATFATTGGASMLSNASNNGGSCMVPEVGIDELAQVNIGQAMLDLSQRVFIFVTNQA